MLMLDFTLAKITYLSQANLTRLFCNGANLLLTVITQQIHVAKQKHAFIQHPFDKRRHDMHSILLNRNDKIFQLPALLCFSAEEKFQCINIQFQKHQIIGLKIYALPRDK